MIWSCLKVAPTSNWFKPMAARNVSKQCPYKSIKDYISGRSVNTRVNAISRLCSLLALSYCLMLLCVLTTPLLFSRFRNLPSCLQNLAKSQEESSKLTFFVLQKLVPFQTWSKNGACNSHTMAFLQTGLFLGFFSHKIGPFRFTSERIGMEKKMAAFLFNLPWINELC